jgi:hypothetical protein
MRGAQAGAIVTLTYDWWGDGLPPAPGDYLVSEAGSGYLIRRARATARNGRWRFQCEKVEPGEIPADARVCSLEWYRSVWGSKKRDQLDFVTELSELQARS